MKSYIGLYLRPFLYDSDPGDDRMILIGRAELLDGLAAHSN